MGLPLPWSWGFPFCSPSFSHLIGFTRNLLYYLLVSSVFLLMTQPYPAEFPPPLPQSCYAQLLFLLSFFCCLLLCQYPSWDFPLSPLSSYATSSPLHSTFIYTIVQHTIGNPRVGCLRVLAEQVAVLVIFGDFKWNEWFPRNDPQQCTPQAVLEPMLPDYHCPFLSIFLVQEISCTWSFFWSNQHSVQEKAVKRQYFCPWISPQLLLAVVPVFINSLLNLISFILARQKFSKQVLEYLDCFLAIYRPK